MPAAGPGGEVISPVEDVLIRVRMSQSDAHYAGNLVDGARVVALFGDVATELLIRYDGDEGLFQGYDRIQFVRPVYAGDYIEARGRIVRTGTTSRVMEFYAYKVIAARPNGAQTSAAVVLDPPQLVCRARGTCTTPRSRQQTDQVEEPDII
jgi:3-aminobutyryl-CoA ammonia-lyase